MAAAQTPGTPATAEAAPSAEPVDSGDPLADALASLTGEPEAEPEKGDAPAEKKAEAKPEAETEKKPEEQPDGGKKRRRTLAEVEKDLLDPKTLSTPDGVMRAIGHFRDRQIKNDSFHIRLKEWETELTQRETAMNSAYESANAELETDRRRAAAIRKIDETLTSGTVEEMLETLGRIRGTSGRAVWDQMARVAIKMGQAAPVAAPAEIQRLEAQIEQLKGIILDREQRETDAAHDGEAAQLQAGLKEREDAVIAAASDAAKHPELARCVRLGLRENIIAEVVKQKRAARAAGRQLDNAGALAQIEADLARVPSAGAAERQLPGSSATPGSGAPHPSSPGGESHPATSIAPSQTRSAGSVRDKTEAELAEDLAKDHDFLRGAGLLL